MERSINLIFKYLNNQLFKKKSVNFSLLAIFFSILIPLLYFYKIGRDRYYVRSDVVVRKAGNGQEMNMGLGSILGGGNLGSIEDSYYLRTYLESPQVLEDLQKVFPFKDAYEKSGLDFYAGLSKKWTNERIYKFFRKQVSISLNSTTGEIKISTVAYDPDSALKINNFLISQAELFVNNLNQNVYKRQLDFVNNEVSRNSKLLNESIEKLQQFQKDNEIINMQDAVISNQSIISALERELANKKVELSTLRRRFLDPKAPEIIILSDQVEELKDLIKEEKILLVSPNGKKLNEIAAAQNRLEANVQFSTDLYNTSLTAAEKTRVDSLQQQRFMAILSKPIMPDDQWYYWRHRGFLTSISILIVGFSLTKFLLGMAESHNN